ncbi:MAG TPA: hypothetical protein VGF97_08845 [Rhizomicrobium sp.]|jgi:hypothetical protein
MLDEAIAQTDLSRSTTPDPMPLYVGPARIPDDIAFGYADFFSPLHSNAQPVILADGTSVKWPPHWTRPKAAAWRHQHGIVKHARI